MEGAAATTAVAVMGADVEEPTVDDSEGVISGTGWGDDNDNDVAVAGGVAEASAPTLRRSAASANVSRAGRLYDCMERVGFRGF